MSNNDDYTFITFRKEGKFVVGTSFSAAKPTEETFTNWGNKEKKTTNNDESSRDIPNEELPSFSSVIDSFLSIMTTYRNMISTTIDFSPALSAMMANKSVADYVKSNGELIQEFETSEFSVYRLHIEKHHNLSRQIDQATAALQGAEHLPELGVIGLLSVYDAYLGRLLKCIFSLKPEIVFSADRQISFSDLTSFGSMEEAKNYIIDKDVETVLRDSHHEHFNWMEKKFSISLTKGLKIWPDFIEICERRNLLTHTGGIVSKQYIKNCTDHNCMITSKIGDKLETDSEYFRKAVRVISEIGIKLGHVLWRKLLPADREKADRHLNETCFNLISLKQYILSENVLDLAVNTFTKHSSDSIRRYMVVNYANAIRLQEKQEQANKVLEKEDWSATSDEFQICVAAVKNELDTLCNKIKKAGKNGEITIQGFRDWPVFLKAHESQEFQDTILDIFGEPLNPTPSKYEMIDGTVLPPPSKDSLH